MKKLISAIASISMGVSLAAHSALATNNTTKNSLVSFSSIVRDQQANCPKLNCTNSSITLKKLSTEEFYELKSEVRAQLAKVGADIADNIWSDTILEGPFYNQNQVRLEAVEVVMHQNRAIGWRVTYSDRAWDIESCAFDSKDLSTLEKCDSGHIVESAFSSFDFTEEFRDDESSARYYPDLHIAD